MVTSWSHLGVVRGRYSGPMPMDAAQAAQQDAPTTELVTAVGDRCANCNATLASDQRYCLDCGERRGRARFSYDTFAAQSAAAPVEVAALPPSRGRFSSGTTLVAGVATLLIAIGVGVLIGHYSANNGAARAAAPQVITVGGGGGAGAAATNGTASNGTTAAAHGKSSKLKVTKVVVTAKTAQAATAAASKVLGSGTNLSKNVQQQIGASCTGGSGCQNGKFTGNFFPGG
jgi:hypothetical protein